MAFGGGEYWVTTVDHGDDSYTVTSRARINEQTRAIEVVIAPEELPIFNKALFGDLDLGASGNVFTDSYDSEAGSYASQAVNWDEKAERFYAEPHGDLGSNRNILLRGGVSVIGDAVPGPGYCVQISGTKVYVAGSTAPAGAPQLLPPVEFDPPIEAVGSFSAVSDENKTLSGGVYRFQNFNVGSKSVIHFSGDVTLYIDSRFNIDGQAQLVVDENSSVTIYHNGEDFSLTGQGMVNETQKASAFRLFSKATTVKFAGTSDFYGAVYAPNATVVPTGTTQIFGSFVGRQIDVGGTTDFHYDAALSRMEEDKRIRLKRVSWRRVPSADM
jgi:hypothetical protein